MTETPPLEIDLTSIDRGSVTAPAGFGKTQVIAGTIAKHHKQRFLILTHTNAGVRALHDRITRIGTQRAARIDTISGIALRLARAFPTGIGWNEEEGIDHHAAKVAAHTILHRPTVRRALLNSYDRIIIDEYQDCSVIQHEIISHLANFIPTVVLGDPLQAIFDFDPLDPLISWSQAQSVFPAAGTLTTPHRWASTNPPLGQWLKSIREPLGAGRPVPLPHNGIVNVYRMPRSINEGGLNGALRGSGSSAILIPDSQKAHEIPWVAKKLARTSSVHEAVDHPELLTFVDKIADGRSPEAVLLAAIDFTTKTTTGINAQSPVKTLTKNLKTNGHPGRNKNDLNRLAHQFIATQSANTLAIFISTVISGRGCATYRPGLLYALLSTLRALGTGPIIDLPDAARRTIEARRRMAPSPTTRSNIGSTLRMKGLEYDSVTLIDPARVPSAQHLYVALSRARRRITLVIPPDSHLGQWFVSNSPR
ncbi:UvrD-helicase domain-containing protein [Rhodococcus rhodochrous]|uniref:UvrD-helicase domain-containing protein n=1 Tax=Rhodococcus rhodochrous TaxID=1829 RepID=UPI000E75FC65